MVPQTMHRFRLFVAGTTLNSARAASNLAVFCRTHLPERHVIEIVDVFETPLAALDQKVFLTPMLIRMEPGPQRRVIGTLSDVRPLLDALGLENGGPTP